jgi:hypothetical protein
MEFSYPHRVTTEKGLGAPIIPGAFDKQKYSKFGDGYYDYAQNVLSNAMTLNFCINDMSS